MSPKWICECANEDCREEFSLHTRDYVRSSKFGQHLVIPGHERPQDEVVGAIRDIVLIILPAATDD